MATLHFFPLRTIFGSLILTCCHAASNGNSAFIDVCGKGDACEKAFSLESGQDDSEGVSLLQHSAATSRGVQTGGDANDGKAKEYTHLQTANGTSPNPQQNMSCIKNTGGTCLVAKCDTWRGPTVCTSLGTCMCATGYCASPGGKCKAQENKLIAHRFRLISAYYPTYSMAVSGNGGLASIFGQQVFSNYGVYISQTVTNESYFDLYEYPGEGDKPSKFLLASSALKNQVVNIFQTRIDLVPGQRHNARYFEVGITPAQGGLLDSPATVESLTMKIFKAPTKICGEKKKATKKERQAIVINSFEYGQEYLGVSWWTSAVTTVQQWWGDSGYPAGVGSGALWYADPPLPFKLKASNFECQSGVAVRSFWLSIITVSFSLQV